MTDLLRVQEDKHKILLLRTLIAAVTAIIVAFILGLVFLVALVALSGSGFDAKAQQTFKSIAEYLSKAFVFITSSIASIWGVLKIRDLRSRRPEPTPASPPPATVRLAVGDEDTDPQVLRHAASQMLLKFGKDVVRTEKGSLATFKRTGKVFARIHGGNVRQDADGNEFIVTLKVYGVLDLVKEPFVVEELGDKVSPKNTWGTLVFPVLKRGDIQHLHPWIEKCYIQAEATGS